MANFHQSFKEFNSTIRLNQNKRESLKRSRESLREKIRKYFREEKPNEILPNFKMQGSMLMDTAIEPIPEVATDDEGKEKKLYEYDVDDGIYFIGEKKERKHVQTYHNWIYEAVYGHTKETKDKTTCVRSIYADGHHIDFPIYFKEEGKVPELAHKSQGWLESDPKAFADWFEERTKEQSEPAQLRRMVRYLKAWCAHRRRKRKDKKMPSGFIMTILACDHYSPHERDDIALKETLVNIQHHLKWRFECLRPTAPKGENLLEKYKAHQDYFMEQLDAFITDATQALQSDDRATGCAKWQKHLGDRFPCRMDDPVNNDEESKGLKETAKPSVPWLAIGGIGVLLLTLIGIRR